MLLQTMLGIRSFQPVCAPSAKLLFPKVTHFLFGEPGLSGVVLEPAVFKLHWPVSEDPAYLSPFPWWPFRE